MQQNRKLQAVAGRKIRKKEMTTEERQWSQQIQDAVKRFFWNKKKFCNSEERLDDATKMIAMGMEIDELDGLKVGSKSHRRALVHWTAENRDLVRTHINGCRNYAHNMVRFVYVERYAAGKSLLTADDVLDCATREPHLMETEEGKQKFAEYWDIWLPRAAFGEHWDPHIRHTMTISEAMHGDDRPRAFRNACIPPSTEAFLYMLVLNGTHGGKNSRFHKLGELKKVRTFWSFAFAH